MAWAGAMQLTSLRAWHPAAPTPALGSSHRRWRCPAVHASIGGGLDVLRKAETLPSAPPPAALEVQEGGDACIPAYEDWAHHPELLQGCEPGAAPLKVAVLLSGGVDSSLALHLLKAAGHEVTAFYLQIWFQEDFANFWGSCPWEEDLQYCQQVCEQLGVKLERVPLTQQYWARVVAHTIDEIKRGRTPNPDVLCNSRVKFGAFYEYLESEHGGSFDRVASGHYARLERRQQGSGTAAAPPASEQQQQQYGQQHEQAYLALTPDAVKDQTYFLAHLSQRQLARTTFPLGHLTKAQVRRLAAEAALPNQARRDSQGICFLGKVKFDEFVQEHLGEWPGPFVEEESGELVGYHRGFWFHTVGQRKGIRLAGGPWYVTRKDPHTNVVHVSRQYYEPSKQRNSFACGGFSWCSDARPQPHVPLYCKVRHGPNMYRCQLHYDPSGQAGYVLLEGTDQGLAAGQYAVFYQHGICLGSATIASSDLPAATPCVAPPLP